MDLTAVLTPAEEGGYVALNPETGTTTQGETFEEAITNLKEATTLFLSEFPLSGIWRIHRGFVIAYPSGHSKDGRQLSNTTPAVQLNISKTLYEVRVGAQGARMRPIRS